MLKTGPISPKMQSGDKGPYPEVSAPIIYLDRKVLTSSPQSLSESEKRHFNKYGKLPLSRRSKVYKISSLVTHANQKSEGTDIL